MEELSLHILDIAENCIKANAKKVDIKIDADVTSDFLTISITDDGCGMDEVMVANAVDPFVTTRTTRRVGLGLALLKQSAEVTGGSIEILSALGKGTTVLSTFVISSIDRLPLGDLSMTVMTLVSGAPDVHFVINTSCDDNTFCFDSKEAEEIFGESLTSPQLYTVLKEYLNENFEMVFGGII